MVSPIRTPSRGVVVGFVGLNRGDKAGSISASVGSGGKGGGSIGGVSERCPKEIGDGGAASRGEGGNKGGGGASSIGAWGVRVGAGSSWGAGTG